MPSRASRTAVRSLPELQREFLAAVLSPGGDAPAWVRRGGPGAAARLGVYRANARENFLAALAAGFPWLRELMGRQEFAELAWSYQRRCPSVSGNLQHVGARLPAFLAEHLTGTGREPLASVAMLEWAMQEVANVARQEARLDLAELAAVPAERHATLSFATDPAMRVLCLPHALFAAWAARQSGRAAGSAGLPAGPEHLIVRRARGRIEVGRLEPGRGACLAALAAGEPLGAAVDACLAQGLELDLAAALPEWVAEGLIIGLRPAGTAAGP